MGIYNKFKTSEKLEREGITLDLGEVRIRLARAGGANAKYNAAIARVSREHKRAIENDLMSDARALAVISEVYANTVVLDWETRTGGTDDEPEYTQGIEGPSGELLPVTPENLLTTFKNLPDLFLEIKATAETLSYYRASNAEAITKN